jgi:hypothetical protein
LTSEIATDSSIRIDFCAGKEVIKRFFLDGIDCNTELTPSGRIRGTAEICADTTAAKFAWRDKALVLAGEALEIVVGELSKERRIAGKGHRKNCELFGGGAIEG